MSAKLRSLKNTHAQTKRALNKYIDTWETGDSVEEGPRRAANLLLCFGKDAVTVGRGEVQLAADGLDEVPDPGAGGHLKFLHMGREKAPGEEREREEEGSVGSWESRVVVVVVVPAAVRPHRTSSVSLGK